MSDLSEGQFDSASHGARTAWTAIASAKSKRWVHAPHSLLTPERRMLRDNRLEELPVKFRTEFLEQAATTSARPALAGGPEQVSARS